MMRSSMINTRKARKKREIRQAHKRINQTSKCKWCGKRYKKTHTAQKYCSTKCTTESKRERDRQWHNKHKRKYRKVGTTNIGQHAHKNEEIEKLIILKEKRRTGL